MGTLDDVLRDNPATYRIPRIQYVVTDEHYSKEPGLLTRCTVSTPYELSNIVTTEFDGSRPPTPAAGNGPPAAETEAHPTSTPVAQFVSAELAILCGELTNKNSLIAGFAVQLGDARREAEATRRQLEITQRELEDTRKQLEESEISVQSLEVIAEQRRLTIERLRRSQQQSQQSQACR
jgi:hypothetical protein